MNTLTVCPPASDLEDQGQTADVDAISPATVLELLNDEYVRGILDALEDGSRPASELVGECESSSPTVYRRLNRLEETGLVKSSIALHPNGHHRKEFTTSYEQVTLNFRDGELVAEIAASGSAGDRADAPSSGLETLAAEHAHRSRE